MSPSIPLQTSTAYQFLSSPHKQQLLAEFKGKPLTALRTPALVINRDVFANNCAEMHKHTKAWGAKFRAHIKTHKTAEGTRLQMISSADKTSAIVVSTLPEAWLVLKSGLVADGTVKDILYGLPVGPNKIADLATIWDEMDKYGGTVRILVDSEDQIALLEAFEQTREQPRRWSAFVKIDGGQKRAGISTLSPTFEPFLTRIFGSSAISVYGFYCHAGNAYASTSISQATSFLSAEVEAVNNAAGRALDICAKSPYSDAHQKPFILSVGSTPTAHAVASAETREKLSQVLNGALELHAGNYPVLDLQQLYTGLIDESRIAQTVIATVISYYPGRGRDDSDEVLIDAGALAMSKDTGPSGSFGEVIGKPWNLGRISQEHGTLIRRNITPSSGGIGINDGGERLELGSQVAIYPQHACLTAAAYPWYYIVDSNIDNAQTVIDVWIPVKAW